MGDLSVDTRIEGENGRYRAQLRDEWRVWGPNGGYPAAIALRAAGAEARIPRPVAFAAHFVASARVFDAGGRLLASGGAQLLCVKA